MDRQIKTREGFVKSGEELFKRHLDSEHDGGPFVVDCDECVEIGMALDHRKSMLKKTIDKAKFIAERPSTLPDRIFVCTKCHIVNEDHKDSDAICDNDEWWGMIGSVGKCGGRFVLYVEQP